MELSLSPDNQDVFEADLSPPSSLDTFYDSTCSPLSGKGKIWLCPTCNVPQGEQDMIGCDLCDEWFHFDCVGIEVAPS